MASIRLTGAACAGLLAVVSATAASAQTGPATAAAATVWQLRSGLNVAALACRGEAEQAIVAGYNRLLTSHRAELAGVYQQVSHEYRSADAFDSAMTRLYNTYAQPAAQAALCANAAAVLDRLAAQGDRPLGEVADTALVQLQDAGGPPVLTQVAVAAIPQIVDERQLPSRARRWSERAARWDDERRAEELRTGNHEAEAYYDAPRDRFADQEAPPVDDEEAADPDDE